MTIIKHRQVLPRWLADQMLDSSKIDRDLLIFQLVELGWTQTAIGEAISISREGVRQIHKKMLAVIGSSASESHAHLPQPPVRPAKPKKTYVVPSDSTLDRLRMLMPIAQKVRGKSRRYRKEAEEFTALLNHAHKIEGVSIARLSKLLGVTHGAIRFRLCRYGYLKPVSGKSMVYNPVRLENRFG
jgi:hypothetical protein